MSPDRPWYRVVLRSRLCIRADADPSSLTAAAEAWDHELGGECEADCDEIGEYFGGTCETGACQPRAISRRFVYAACESAWGDPFTISAAVIEWNELRLGVDYGGGCATHTFTPCWPDQAFAESNPVQVALELYHDAHGDTCDMAIVGEPVVVDLIDLRDAWRAAYGQESGTIEVRFGGESLLYTF